MLFSIIKTLLTIIEVVVSILLVTAILIQKSKTQGAGLAFGSGMGETLFGGQIGNVMTKITVVLAVIFLVNTTALTFIGVKAKYRRAVPAASAPMPQPGQPPVENGAGTDPGSLAPMLPSPDEGGSVPVSPAE